MFSLSKLYEIQGKKGRTANSRNFQDNIAPSLYSETAIPKPTNSKQYFEIAQDSSIQPVATPLSPQYMPNLKNILTDRTASKKDSELFCFDDDLHVISTFEDKITFKGSRVTHLQPKFKSRLKPNHKVCKRQPRKKKRKTNTEKQTVNNSFVSRISIPREKRLGTVRNVNKQTSEPKCASSDIGLEGRELCSKSNDYIPLFDLSDSHSSSVNKEIHQECRIINERMTEVISIDSDNESKPVYTIESSGDEDIIESPCGRKMHKKLKKKRKRNKDHVKSPLTDSITKCFNKTKRFTLPYQYKYFPGTGLFIVMEPGSKFYFSGAVFIQQVIGICSIYGYCLEANETQEVFSSRLNGTFSIDVEKTEQIGECRDRVEMIWQWLKTTQSKEAEVAVVKMTSSSNAASNLLSSLKSYEDSIFMLKKTKANQSPTNDDPEFIREILAVHTEENERQANKFAAVDCWMDIISNIVSFGPHPKVVVCGGKGAGKSVFLKYLVNKCLSSKAQSICCLDADPGQSEFSLPGVLSVVHIYNPILVPTFALHSHILHNKKKEILLGAVDVSTVSRQYLNVVKGLISDAGVMASNENCPLIVNTMGFTKHIGLDIVIDIIRMVQPTHVVQIQMATSNDFAFELSAPQLMNSRRGLISKNVEGKLTYKLHVINSFRQMASQWHNVTPKIKREINTVGYFSSLWHGQEAINCVSCQPPISIRWTDVALHICHSDLDFSLILLAINAQLVAMCHVEEHCVKTVGENLPMILFKDRWEESHKCLGWAVVRGIDPSTRELYLLTPVSKDVVKTQVNALILTHNHFPSDFYKIFAPDGGPYYSAG